MDFHGILAKPIQIMKEVLDLEPELESPSLASQFVAVKHQLDEVQARLNESYRISREKDIVIAKLQKAIAAKTPAPAAPSPTRAARPVQVDATRRSESVAPPEPPIRRTYAPERNARLQTAASDEVKLPPVPSYEAARQQVQATRRRVVARTVEPQPPAQRAKAAEPKTASTRTSRTTTSATKAKARETKAAKPKAASTRATRAAASTAKAKAKPRTSAKASKPATTKKAKATRARATTRKPATKAKAKATTARAKSTARTRKKS